MSKEWSKEIFAKNLKCYMESAGKNQKEMADIVGVSAPTFNEWLKAKKYPRIDKVEKLANYFGILKSDLIEDKTEMKKNNDAMSDIILKMRVDEDFFEAVTIMYSLNKEKFSSVKQMLTLLK